MEKKKKKKKKEQKKKRFIFEKKSVSFVEAFYIIIGMDLIFRDGGNWSQRWKATVQIMELR